MIIVQLGCYRMSVAIPLSSMYGYDIKTLDDPCIKAADESTTEAASLLLPGNLVNVIPALAEILVWLPGSPTMKAAAHVRHLTNEMMRIPTEYVEKQFVSFFFYFRNSVFPVVSEKVNFIRPREKPSHL